MGRARPPADPLTNRRLVQGKGSFLELGAGEFKARAEVPTSSRGAGGTEPLWLFCSTGLGHEDGNAAKLRRRRRAPVVSGRPSACHGCAVACIGQPPPPFAPGPVWGGGHGCSPAAAVAGPSLALMGKRKALRVFARLRGQPGIQA